MKYLMKLIKALFKFCAFLFSNLPKKIQYLFADILGLFVFDVVRLRREIMLDNLDTVFPAKTKKEKLKIARRSLMNMARGLIEYTWLPFLTSSKVNDIAEVRGIEYLTKARVKGKGVALLSLHVGNGDLGGAILSLSGLPIVIISKEFKLKWLNDLWFGMRRRLGTRFIAPRNSSFAVLKSLKKEDLVVFVMDQFTGPPIGVKSTFFNKETGTGMGLAVMVQRSKSPVVPCYTFRDANNKSIVVFEAEIPFVELGDKDQTILNMTETYNRKLEEIILKYPDQWMWLHRRWKKHVVT